MHLGQILVRFSIADRTGKDVYLCKSLAVHPVGLEVSIELLLLTQARQSFCFRVVTVFGLYLGTEVLDGWRSMLAVW